MILLRWSCCFVLLCFTSCWTEIITALLFPRARRFIPNLGNTFNCLPVFISDQNWLMCYVTTRDHISATTHFGYLTTCCLLPFDEDDSEKRPSVDATLSHTVVCLLRVFLDLLWSVTLSTRWFIFWSHLKCSRQQVAMFNFCIQALLHGASTAASWVMARHMQIIELLQRHFILSVEWTKLHQLLTQHVQGGSICRQSY